MDFGWSWENKWWVYCQYWANGGLTIYKRISRGLIVEKDPQQIRNYSLVNIYIAMENHYLNRSITYKWSMFHSKLLVSQSLTNENYEKNHLKRIQTSQCLPSQVVPTCRCHCRCEPPTTSQVCPPTGWESHHLAHPPGKEKLGEKLHPLVYHQLNFP